jgi:hypothetical protein
MNKDLLSFVRNDDMVNGGCPHAICLTPTDTSSVFGFASRMLSIAISD